MSMRSDPFPDSDRLKHAVFGTTVRSLRAPAG
jgi:hypothetical protein